MDDFEKEYFAELKKLSANYETRRKQLAESRIRMFAAALYRQLVDEKVTPDVLLAAGNSGLFMTEIAKKVFEEANILLPPTVTIPLFRYQKQGEQFVSDNNQSLLENVKHQVRSVTKDDLQILFIDDELMTGQTVRIALSLLFSARPTLQHIHCITIAEHHFFEWHYHIPKVSLNFFAYARLIQGLNGNISHLIPEDFFEEIKQTIPQVESYNHAMAILIGGALKQKDSANIPFYNRELVIKLQSKIPQYEKKKEELQNEISELVKEGIEQYKNGTIVFRF